MPGAAHPAPASGSRRVIGAPILAGLGLFALVGAYAWPQLARTAQFRALRKKCRATRSLVLTYDDGPGDELTPAPLGLLGAAGARATFFPTGRSATRNPELLSRVAAPRGPAVGCHSQNHLHVWRADRRCCKWPPCPSM